MKLFEYLFGGSVSGFVVFGGYLLLVLIPYFALAIGKRWFEFHSDEGGDEYLALRNEEEWERDLWDREKRLEERLKADQSKPERRAG